MKNLSERLHKNGNIVHIHDTRIRLEWNPDFVEGITCHKFPGVAGLLISLFKDNYDIVHMHTGAWKLLFAYIELGQFSKRKNILTLHSFRDDLSKNSRMQIFIIRYVLERYNTVVAVNNPIREKILRLCENAKCVVASPYIKAETIEHTELPREIDSLIRSNKKLIVACASATELFGGEDLYGMDMAIALAAHLKEKGFDFNLLYIITEITDTKHYQRMKKYIEQMDVQDIFHTQEYRLPFATILEATNLFIRPTASDGYPLSLAEAIDAGVPCVASDVCERPEGCGVFSKKNQAEFNFMCEEYVRHEKKMASNLLTDGYKILSTLYSGQP